MAAKRIGERVAHDAALSAALKQSREKLHVLNVYYVPNGTMKPLAHMAPFFSRFPELAARETRTISLLQPHAGLPAGDYGFLELYCNEPTCDCRRVLFQVCRADRPNKVLATINYGWESEDFYAQWLHGDRESARELAEASLDPLNPQSKLSPALLEVFRHILLQDPAYVDRLRRHYRMFKRAQRGSAPALTSSIPPV